MDKKIPSLLDILTDMRVLLQQIARHTEPRTDSHGQLGQRRHKQEVLDLLGISPRTYDRYKARGFGFLPAASDVRPMDPCTCFHVVKYWWKYGCFFRIGASIFTEP